MRKLHVAIAIAALAAPWATALHGCGPTSMPGQAGPGSCNLPVPLAGLLTVEVRDAAGAPRAGVVVVATVARPNGSNTYPPAPTPAASASAGPSAAPSMAPSATPSAAAYETVRALSCAVGRGPEEGQATTDAAGRATFRGLAIGPARVTAGALTATVMLERDQPASVTLAPSPAPTPGPQ